MRKLFSILTLICLSFIGYNFTQADEIANIQLDMRGYDEITLNEGTFIPVLNLQQISTETCPEGYKVKFQVTDDMFLSETKVIPRGTDVYGYIEKINEPIIGTNASMKIKATQLVLLDGYEIPIKGYVYTANNNVIGGDLTEPAEYIKMPHYQSKYQGIAWNHRGATLQMRPGGRRSMGKNIKINPGERLIIVLTAPAAITHILED